MVGTIVIYLLYATDFITTRNAKVATFADDTEKLLELCACVNNLQSHVDTVEVWLKK